VPDILILADRTARRRCATRSPIGVRVEDLVLVTEDGCEKLGDFTYDLVV